MFTVFHTIFNKTIREFKDSKEALAYCKYLNLLCYSKSTGASPENCFTVVDISFETCGK